MELADDIAYGIHDLEDGIALRLIDRDHWNDALKQLDSTWANQCQLNKDWLSKSLFDRPSSEGNRKLAVGALVNAMVTSVRIHRRDQFTCPLLAYAAELLDPAETFRKALTKLTKDHIIRTQNGQTLEYRGRQIVMSLFEALESDREALLPEKSLTNSLPGEDPQREICDYVAGMTDTYAIRMYERLFMPRQGSIFERL
ncbi:MAG TPA: hypothetical protein VFA07_09875 [Chthonomonadaceae bacterium]|nr:hypothetical protein [Chthonomonadaceae bacterium]